MTTATETAPAPRKASLGSRAFGFLQKIGKSVMLPVSVLPVAGILLGVGGAFIGGYQRRAQAMGICTLDGAPSPCGVEGAVGDPLTAGIVAKPLFVLPAGPAGVRWRRSSGRCRSSSPSVWPWA